MPSASTTVRDRDRRTIARTKPPCGICGGTIDYQLPHLDPMSYVVDHIIPTSKGGLDELANKQAAHRRPILQPHQVRHPPSRHTAHRRMGNQPTLVVTTEPTGVGGHPAHPPPGAPHRIGGCVCDPVFPATWWPSCAVWHALTLTSSGQSAVRR